MVAPQLPEPPVDVRKCLEDYVKVPRGNWTGETVLRIINAYRRREVELEKCLYLNDAFYKDLQRGYANRFR